MKMLQMCYPVHIETGSVINLTRYVVQWCYMENYIDVPLYAVVKVTLGERLRYEYWERGMIS